MTARDLFGIRLPRLGDILNTGPCSAKGHRWREVRAGGQQCRTCGRKR